MQKVDRPFKPPGRVLLPAWWTAQGEGRNLIGCYHNQETGPAPSNRGQRCSVVVFKLPTCLRATRCCVFSVIHCLEPRGQKLCDCCSAEGSGQKLHWAYKKLCCAWQRVWGETRQELLLRDHAAAERPCGCCVASGGDQKKTTKKQGVEREDEKGEEGGALGVK